MKSKFIKKVFKKLMVTTVGLITLSMFTASIKTKAAEPKDVGIEIRNESYEIDGYSLHQGTIINMEVYQGTRFYNPYGYDIYNISILADNGKVYSMLKNPEDMLIDDGVLIVVNVQTGVVLSLVCHESP